MTDQTPTSHPIAAGWYADADADGSGKQRWWDGSAWSGHVATPPTVAAPSANGLATVGLILGILGFLGMGIPFFIGWFIGGPLDILGLIFGIVGAAKSGERGGAGKASSIVAIVLAGVSLLSVFVGAGTAW